MSWELSVRCFVDWRAEGRPLPWGPYCCSSHVVHDVVPSDLPSFLICSLFKSLRYNHTGWLGLKFQLFISTLQTCFQSYNWKEETGGLENAETDLTYCSLVAVAAVYDCFEHLYRLWLWLLSSTTASSVLIDFSAMFLSSWETPVIRTTPVPYWLKERSTHPVWRS